MIVEWMGARLVGSPFVPTTDRDPQVNAQRLQSIAGSGREAARQLGVAESTLRGWRKGVRPKDPAANQRMVAMGRQLAAARTGELARVRRDPNANGLVIKGIIRVSNDQRTRTILVGRHIPADTMRRILTAWANGVDDSKVDAMLHRAITSYYAPTDFVSIQGVWFE